MNMRFPLIIVLVAISILISCGEDEPTEPMCTENTYYRDMDGDGKGDPNNSTTSCTLPSGYVPNDWDDDDNDAGGSNAAGLPEVDNNGYDFTAADTDGWELIFEDNFNTDITTSWNLWDGGAFNNELQLYKAGNAQLGNDYLYINAKRENRTGRTNPFDSTDKSFSFTSARLESKAVYSPSQQGGTLRMAARIRLPKGEGLWPAFWSYGDPWPTEGEIDVMEFRAGEVNEYTTNFFYGTNENQPLTNNGQSYEYGSDMTTQFHVFECIWTQNMLEMKLDGQVIRTMSSTDYQYVTSLYNKREKIVLNLAVGGDFFQNLDASQIPDESYLIVDWVRLYKQ